jgi:hypothetical protein
VGCWAWCTSSATDPVPSRIARGALPPVDGQGRAQRAWIVVAGRDAGS